MYRSWGMAGGEESIAGGERKPGHSIFRVWSKNDLPLEGGLDGLPLRVFNEGLLRPRVARAKKIIRLHPFLCSASKRTTRLPPSCYWMVGSKLTLAFMELEIRQFASAFSISSLALAASAFAESLMVGFNMMAVN